MRFIRRHGEKGFAMATAVADISKYCRQIGGCSHVCYYSLNMYANKCTYVTADLPIFQEVETNFL